MDEAIQFAKWVIERGIVGSTNRTTYFWFNTQDGTNPEKTMEEIYTIFKEETDG